MVNDLLLHFQTVDLILYAAALKVGEVEVISKHRSKADRFTELVAAIISQQLSTKAAETIWARVVSVMPKGGITPANILSIDTEIFRKQGMSYSKIKYIKDLAQKIMDAEINLDKLNDLEDEAVITELIQVKGIGRWTAEMFLMFSLNRPDVFSIGDLGLKRAIQKLYGLKKEPDEPKLLSLSQKWSPYRSHACRILWKSLDNQPTKNKD